MIAPNVEGLDNWPYLRSLIVSGATELSLALTPEQVDRLGRYLALLIKWNKAYNLTAIRDPEQMVRLHLLDSLAVHQSLGAGQRILDVGTGPGLPGIVLAIMNPDKTFVLLDSNGKKTRFLFQVRASLDLKQVSIQNSRVEAYHPKLPFDIITSRAFASLSDMLSWCGHLVATDGCFLAMKGQYPEQEIAELPEEYCLVESQPVLVPGIEGQRHLLRIRRQ
jgi:16S rRNA (guanine527-N7)-methyltransferase